MQLIEKYFPDLSQQQLEQFQELTPLYKEWNEKINVISRKDIDNLNERHILHSLALAKIVNFKAGSEILDLGTGGGFPGIPLAIFFPEVKFTLIDGTRKKITVVDAIAQKLELDNVKAKHLRAEECKHRFDFVVSRAVTRLERLIPWSFRLLKHKQVNPIPNGLFAWKGGNIKEEIKALPNKEYIEKYPIPQYFKEEYFQEKQILYIQG